MPLESDDRTNEPFGEAVRTLLKAERRSQSMLSKELGLSKDHVSRMLNGQRSTSVEQIEKIASLLDKPASFFIEVRLVRIAAYLRQNNCRLEELWDELPLDRA